MKASEIMTTRLVMVNVVDSAIEAAEKMKSEKVGTVLVIENERLKGLVTDRQIVTKVIAEGKDPSRIKVKDIMTTNPITGNSEMGICDIAKIIGEKGYRRIPIVEKGRPVGIISSADIVEHAKTCSICMENILKEVAKSGKWM